jgi:mRNA-degrading endonuclease YafQ of YafQ-DinJ toxin-antitoxin module
MLIEIGIPDIRMVYSIDDKEGIIIIEAVGSHKIY